MNFFLDIDGTILPMGAASAPESAVRAIRKVRSEGHRVFLATGRSPAEVMNSIYDIGLDGGVFAAGASIILDGKEIYHRVFTEGEKEEAFSYCRAHSYGMLIQSDKGTWTDQKTVDHWYDLMKKYIGREVKVDALVISSSIPRDLSVNKILYISDNGQIEKIRKELSSHFTVVDNTVGLPADLMGEIVLKGISKATGIEKILEVLHEGRNSVCAVGDGANDIEMIEYAHTGIAMGNATDGLKAAADWTAPDILSDGLAAALEYALHIQQNGK